ncbi:hypothetical protein [Halomonas campaniensis]|uniref:DNA topoisomerase type IA zn finger domain-containing protein n=1 Tax=Halomonas campaniensis TaxID=213554 RepID=A0A246S5T9_9GAMM|nr:hypothetical protein [Halomonas campaniensis]OWV31253.1 hypothetical protein JI62_02610 [Halomonas campaniensis]
MHLFIEENSELGRASGDAIGEGKREGECIPLASGDFVPGCFEHLLTLSDPKDQDPNAKQCSLESLPLLLSVKHKFIGEKESRIKLNQRLAEQAWEIVHAGYPDEETQAILPVTALSITPLRHEQEQIKAGQLTMQGLVYGVAAQEAERIKPEGVMVTTDTGLGCPSCEKGTQNCEKKKNGFFWGCSVYGECKFSFLGNRR